jgi:hypothetical protein
VESPEILASRKDINRSVPFKTLSKYRPYLPCAGIRRLMRFNVRLYSFSHIFAAAAMLACAYSPLAIARAEAQTTYYVAPNGSDYNNGSINSPWLTPQHSSSVAQPGDTVIFADGTYNLGASGFTGDWFISSGGTSGRPVTYVAQHKWQAKLVGHGSGDGTTVIGMAGGYTIVKDFDITGSNANGINFTTNGTAASYNQAVGNYIHDMVTPCNGNSGAGITAGSGGNNYAGVGHESAIGNLIVNLIAAGGCPGGHQASGIAMMLPYGIVANNIVMNCGDAIEAWHAATNIVFYGNVVLNSARGLSMGAGDSPGGITNNNSVVQNNIIINGSAPAIIETGTTGTNNVYKDNLVFGGNTSIQLHNGLQATGTINADPKFVNNTGTASGDYHLQSSSPARGTGLALAGITTDFAGTARPQSGTTDIGAYLSDVSNTTPTVAINASPTSLSYGGGSSTISWSTTNATSATLNGAAVAVNSSVTVSPTTTTTYTLVAQSASGVTATNAVTVTVGASGPVTAGIAANAASIVSGNSATLTWTSTNAVSGDLNGSAVPVSGSLVVRPTTTTTYRFTATGSSGTSDWGQVTVTVTAPPSGPVTAGAGASPSSIKRGQSSVITWTTKNAVSATLNGTSVPLNGSVTVTPTSTTTYKIVATGASGTTDWGSVTVTVQ